MRRHPFHSLGTPLLLRMRCRCSGLRTDKKKKIQEKIDLDTNPWQRLVKIEVWRVTEPHYSQVGGWEKHPLWKESRDRY